eukprot:7306143-Pyramimonas_sp.AAC.1
MPGATRGGRRGRGGGCAVRGSQFQQGAGRLGAARPRVAPGAAQNGPREPREPHRQPNKASRLAQDGPRGPQEGSKADKTAQHGSDPSESGRSRGHATRAWAPDGGAGRLRAPRGDVQTAP